MLFHEGLGHYGLRGVFGDTLKPLLKQVAGLRRGDMERKAKQYGLQIRNEKGKLVLTEGELETNRLIAAEEILAELAQTRPDSGFVNRAIAAIHAWLRANVPGFKNLQLSDAEIINNYILPARWFLEQGRTQAAPGVLAGAFARSRVFTNTQHMTEQDANRELAGLTKNMRQAGTEEEAKEAASAFITKKPLPPHDIENLETGFIANVSWSSFNKMVNHSAHQDIVPISLPVIRHSVKLGVSLMTSTSSASSSSANVIGMEPKS